MTRVLRSIRITFNREGIEYAVTYQHGDQVATPGTKKRTTTAARVAAEGLRRALEVLGRGQIQWGGFGTNEKVSTDRVIIDRKENVV